MNKNLIQKVFGQKEDAVSTFEDDSRISSISQPSEIEQEEFDDDDNTNYLMAETVEEETLKLEQREIELIKKSLALMSGCVVMPKVAMVMGAIVVAFPSAS